MFFWIHTAYTKFHLFHNFIKLILNQQGYYCQINILRHKMRWIY